MVAFVSSGGDPTSVRHTVSFILQLGSKARVSDLCDAGYWPPDFLVESVFWAQEKRPNESRALRVNGELMTGD